jgi:hypothetical protein
MLEKIITKKRRKNFKHTFDENKKSAAAIALLSKPFLKTALSRKKIQNRQSFVIISKKKKNRHG